MGTSQVCLWSMQWWPLHIVAPEAHLDTRPVASCPQQVRSGPRGQALKPSIEVSELIAIDLASPYFFLFTLHILDQTRCSFCPFKNKSTRNFPDNSCFDANLPQHIIKRFRHHVTFHLPRSEIYPNPILGVCINSQGHNYWCPLGCSA